MTHQTMRTIIVSILYCVVFNLGAVAQGDIYIDRSVDLVRIGMELELNSSIESIGIYNIRDNEEFMKIPFSCFTPDSVKSIGLFSIYNVKSFDFLYMYKNLEFLAISHSSINLNSFDFAAFPRLERLKIEFTPTDTINGSLARLGNLTDVTFTTAVPLKHIANSDSVLRRLQFFRSNCTTLSLSPQLKPILASCPVLTYLTLDVAKCETDFGFLSNMHYIDTLELLNITTSVADSLFRQFKNQTIKNLKLDFDKDLVLPASINKHEQIEYLEVRGDFIKDISSVSLSNLKSFKADCIVFNPYFIFIPPRIFRPTFLEITSEQLESFKNRNQACIITTGYSISSYH